MLSLRHCERKLQNEYEQQCLSADKELAELLGWTSLSNSVLHGKVVLLGELPEELNSFVPRWTRDDAEAFRLAVEYVLTIEVYINCVVVKQFLDEETYTEHKCKFTSEGFPDKLSAVRFAIVQATINKLKGTNK